MWLTPGKATSCKNSAPIDKHLHIIKALTATGWGKQKETLMATYKAVMGPALEYTCSVWSPIASSTSKTNCKSCRTQHWELPQDAHKTQTYNICMTKHSHSPYTSTYSSMFHNTNRKHNIYHIPYTNTQHTSTLQGQNTIFNNGRYTTNIPTDPHTVTTTDIKTNMRHIHTSIVSRHLAIRGNNKILRTHPPHTSSSEERLPRLTRRTLALLRTNNSPFLKSYLHKVDAKTHPSPLCPHCNIHTHDTHHLFNCTHIRTTLSPLDLWTDPPEWLHCWPDGRRSWLVDHKWEHQTPPLARVMEVGRQQQDMATQSCWG